VVIQEETKRTEEKEEASSTRKFIEIGAGGNMGKIQVIEIGAGAVVQKDGQVERRWASRQGSLVQVEKKDEEQRPFEADGNEIFSNRSKQTKAKVGEKIDGKGGTGQSVHWKAS